MTFPGLHFKAEQHNNSLPSQAENGGFFSNNCSAEPSVNAVQHPGRLTFAERSVARVTRLAGAAVAPDHVEAQGVLVAVVLPAEALVVLWGGIKQRFSCVQQRQMFVLTCSCVTGIILTSSDIYRLGTKGSEGANKTSAANSWPQEPPRPASSVLSDASR